MPSLLRLSRFILYNSASPPQNGQDFNLIAIFVAPFKVFLASERSRKHNEYYRCSVSFSVRLTILEFFIRPFLASAAVPLSSYEKFAILAGHIFSFLPNDHFIYHVLLLAAGHFEVNSCCFQIAMPEQVGKQANIIVIAYKLLCEKVPKAVRMH
jgi:hypothetical protein